MGQTITRYLKREYQKLGYTTTRRHVITPAGCICDPPTIKIYESRPFEVIINTNGPHFRVMVTIILTSNGRSHYTADAAGTIEEGPPLWTRFREALRLAWRRCRLQGSLTLLWVAIPLFGQVLLLEWILDSLPATKYVYRRT